MRKVRCCIRCLLGRMLDNKFVFFSIIVVLIIADFFSVFTAVCKDGFERGVENVSAKLGADIIVVSKEYDENLKQALFWGEPSTNMFDKGVLEELKKMPNIADISSQLFIASLDSECCEQQVQFVVYDKKTDFAITSWVENSEDDNLGRNIIVGNDISYDIEDTAIFFDCAFTVVGKMKRTGMGYDTSIFVDNKTADSITRYLKIDSFEEKSSMILINVLDYNKIEDTVNSMNNYLKEKNLIAYQSSEMYNTIQDDIEKFSNVIIVLKLGIDLTCLVALFIIVTMNISSKKNEIISLNELGVDSRMIIMSIFGEGMVEVSIAFSIGITLAFLVVTMYMSALERYFGIPMIMNKQVGSDLVIGFIESIIVVFLSSLYSIIIIKRWCRRKC